MEIPINRESLILWDNDYWEKVRQRTLKVIACIPPEKFDWRYAEGKFSFADIIGIWPRSNAICTRKMFSASPASIPAMGPNLPRDLKT
jgi:hypothetical protein